MGDGRLDDEDLVDHLKLLSQRDLQHINLDKKEVANSIVEGSYLKSEKYHENDLLPCF